MTLLSVVASFSPCISRLPSEDDEHVFSLDGDVTVFPPAVSATFQHELPNGQRRHRRGSHPRSHSFRSALVEKERDSLVIVGSIEVCELCVRVDRADSFYF